MDKKIIKTVGDVISSLIENRAYKAAKYLSDKLVIRVSRRLIKRKLPSKNQNLEIVLTIGRPNFEHREFIKACRKAKEPFPVRGVILKFPPQTKK